MVSCQIRSTALPEATQPDAAQPATPQSEAADQAFELATRVAHRAADASLPLRLLGGQAVRLLCPAFTPRSRKGQDMDFAGVSSARSDISTFLEAQGFVGNTRFNTLHGDRQMLFALPDGSIYVDVMMDRLQMCHVLEFKDRINRMPYTLDVTDLLLSKLQVVEQNAKDAQDIIYLLAAYPVRPGDEPGTIALARYGQVVGSDWGWWRTVTRNLDRVIGLAAGELSAIVPTDPPHSPAGQARQLIEAAEAAPKSLRWKLRAKVGERVQWYELPEEVNHG
jgi:hypothetical protein